MTDVPGLRGLLVRRHSVAVAIANELEELHSGLVAAFKEGLAASAARTELDHDVRTVGGVPQAWATKSAAGLPGHWVTWYTPQEEGRNVEYVAALAMYAADLDGHLAIEICTQMNQRMSGVSGVDLRAEFTKLPPGDHGRWVTAGLISWIRAAEGETAEAMVEPALNAAGEHLKFIEELYRRVLESRAGANSKVGRLP
ncbi:MAG: hypothetical protein ACOC9T_02080 [Myxococcota bacterium]